MFDPEYWYSRKNHKYLQNIDTFYYSVKLLEDFRRESDNLNVINVRKFVDDISAEPEGTSVLFDVKNSLSSERLKKDCVLYYKPGCFARFYNFRLTLPDKFDFFFAPVVPASKQQDGLSLTSEIVIQIRSRYLWEKGCALCVKESFEYVKAFCAMFNLHIHDVKENRCDFCWHTNAIQSPDKFFRSDKLGDMFVTRLGTEKNDDGFKVRTVTTYKDKADPSIDYIAVGKRSDKIFLRIYNKAKEVVQEQYKPWFFYIWLYSGLISRYDMFVFEEAFKQHSWNYVDVARLKFALEYLELEQNVITEINLLIDPSVKTYNYKRIRVLADELTPKVTIILNVEFQCMRAFTRTCQLVPFKDNVGPLSRVLDFLDNRALFTEYITGKTFRIVRPDSGDTNKSRREDCDFWKRLRACKAIDVYLDKHNLHLCRQYSSKLDLQIRKKKAVRAISSVAYAVTHDPDTSLYSDAAELLAMLNDNDLRELDLYKHILAKRHTEEIPPGIIHYRKPYIVDQRTGRRLSS